MGSIIEKLSIESFIAVVGNAVKDLVDGDQEDLNILAVFSTVIEDLVDANQEDANEWFECNKGNVMTSIAVTFGDEKFDQEDPIEIGDNNNPGDLFCSNFSNLPLPFSGITFFSVEGFPFVCVTFVAFLLAFGMILL